MARRMARKVRRGGGSGSRPALAETLESRRLMSVTLLLNNGELDVREDTLGVANSTTIRASGSFMVLSENPHTLTVSTPLSFAGWSATDTTSANGPVTGISRIVVDTADGADQVNILSTVIPITIQPRAAGAGAVETVTVGTASAPDLVAAVTVVAAKSATSKPKVSVKITNIGAAMATASSAQVLLFASADKSLDPLDSKLLTFTASNLKLKTKASKTFTVNGSIFRLSR